MGRRIAANIAKLPKLLRKPQTPQAEPEQGARSMPLDINAGHRFDDRERCAVCGMTRSKWEDTHERCRGRPAPKREAYRMEDDNADS